MRIAAREVWGPRFKLCESNDGLLSDIPINDALLLNNEMVQVTSMYFQLPYQ
jgi:hypothetical protein